MKRTAEPTVIKTVSVSLLGGFALELDGTTLTDDINRSLKLWSVLAYLILHRDRPVSQTEFIETFWPCLLYTSPPPPGWRREGAGP